MVASIGPLNKQIQPEETLVLTEMCFVLCWAPRYRDWLSDGNHTFLDTWDTKTYMDIRSMNFDVPYNFVA